MIVFDGDNEVAKKNWDIYSNDLKHRSEVDLKAIFNKRSIGNIKLKVFLARVQDAIRVGDIDEVDNLIVKREIALKGAKRAKTNRVGEFKGYNWIGIDRLDYRYTPAKRIIRDIMNAEVVNNV